MSFQTVFTEFGQPVELETLITEIRNGRNMFISVNFVWFILAKNFGLSVYPLLKGVCKARDDKSHRTVATKVV